MNEVEKKQFLLTKIKEGNGVSELNLDYQFRLALAPKQAAFSEHMYLINALKKEGLVWETEGGVISLTPTGSDLMGVGGYPSIVSKREMDRLEAIKAHKFTKNMARLNIIISMLAIIVSLYSAITTNGQNNRIYRLENKYEILKNKNRQMRDQIHYFLKK